MKSDADCARGTAEAEQPSEESQKRQARRERQLESLLERTQEEFSALRKRYQQLRRDFQFNLSILDCQNKELEKYDAVLAKVMTVEYSSSDVQELSSKMDKNGWMKVVKQQRRSCLEEELDQEKQDHLQVTEALKASQMIRQKLQNQLKSKEREMTGIVEAKDQRIKALEDEVKRRKSKQKELENDHSQKCEDLARALKTRDARLEAQGRACSEQLRKAEERVVNLLENMDALAAQARRAQEQQQRAVEQKDEIVQRYKQQLSAALVREKEMEQVRVQKDLEWQNRCEDLKAEHYLTNEQLIQDLTEARDQALASLKEKEQELKNSSVSFRSVKAVKDQATQVDSPESEEIQRVQAQNSTLRAAVAQMRKDMEGFGRLRREAQASPQASPPQRAEHRPPSVDASAQASAAAPNSTGEPVQSVALFSRSQEGSPRRTSLPDKRRSDGAPFPPDTNDCAWNEPIKITPAHPPLIVPEQGASVQQLQEKQRQLQRHASSATPLGVLGNTRQAESKHGPMYARLKQAACCIKRLSREKQKLIEMGNCLRAQIATDQLKGSVKPATGLSAERPGVQPDWLSVLEKLQYQLTTQELQYASKNNARDVTGQLLQEAGQQGPSTDGPVGISRQRTATQAFKNREKTGVLSRSQSREPSGGSSFLWSSEELQQSLTVPRETLNAGLRISPYSEGERELSGKEAAGPRRTKARTEANGTGRTQGAAQRGANPSNSKHNGAAGRRIRNYNVKD